ncbi:hypothetical protein E2605_03090 [Dysgonomonas capnocytophagoides]|uniref:DUF2254 domain-containing protein n=1 Tax=Dysgonomonas capnocytophagoides TaxID=45254 RepID=A0A4Y8L9V4_9BACT|nr:hypothetical protein [Dysgonomonas capnocytophagoides]TFD99081.1 hypothetical protein E2605_03090 [Dysgonomonas capnocytophagoides]
MRDFFYVVHKLYNYKIIGLFIFLFLSTVLIKVNIFPDWFGFRYIEEPSNLIITLLSIVIGTSSIILTILLVVYESLSKPFRRNSLDIILDDPWIKLLFSLFSGVFIYLSLTLLVIKREGINTDADLALLYISCIITFFFILAQFPLVILALRYSKSHRFINKLVLEISLSDIDQISKPPKVEDSIVYFETMEKNKLMLLKEIGIIAIKENDWGMPQYILNEVYDILIRSITKETPEKQALSNIEAFCWICLHFSKNTIENSDLITAKCLLSDLYGIHVHLVEIGFRAFRKLSVDKCINDLHRGISSNDNFHSMQGYLLRESCEVIQFHIKSLNFSNEEWPTFDYSLDRLENNEKKTKTSEEINDYMFYINHELADLFFDTLKYAIDTKNKNVYNHISWKINPLLSSIYDSTNLTDYQKEEIFHNYYFKSKRVFDDVYESDMYEEMNISTNDNFYIKQWLTENRKYAFWCLSDTISRAVKLENLGKLSSHSIDSLFLIARGLANEDMNVETKESAIDLIIKFGFNFLKDKKTRNETKKEVIRQFKWLNSYLQKNEELSSLKKEYSSKIDKLK